MASLSPALISTHFRFEKRPLWAVNRCAGACKTHSNTYLKYTQTHTNKQTISVFTFHTYLSIVIMYCCFVHTLRQCTVYCKEFGVYPTSWAHVDTGNPNLIWAVQQNRMEFNLSRSDLNHICRWFANATQESTLRLDFMWDSFVCLFSQSPYNSLTSHCNKENRKWADFSRVW